MLYAIGMGQINIGASAKANVSSQLAKVMSSQVQCVVWGYKFKIHTINLLQTSVCSKELPLHTRIVSSERTVVVCFWVHNYTQKLSRKHRRLCKSKCELIKVMSLQVQCVMSVYKFKTHTINLTLSFLTRRELPLPTVIVSSQYTVVVSFQVHNCTQKLLRKYRRLCNAIVISQLTTAMGSQVQCASLQI